MSLLCSLMHPVWQNSFQMRRPRKLSATPKENIKPNHRGGTIFIKSKIMYPSEELSTHQNKTSVASFLTSGGVAKLVV